MELTKLLLDFFSVDFVPELPDVELFLAVELALPVVDFLVPPEVDFRLLFLEPLVPLLRRLVELDGRRVLDDVLDLRGAFVVPRVAIDDVPILMSDLKNTTRSG